MEFLASPRWEDWKYERRHENKYSFLGKGTSSVRRYGYGRRVSTEEIADPTSSIADSQIEGKGGDRAFYLTKEMHRNPLKLSDYREPTNGAIPINI